MSWFKNVPRMQRTQRLSLLFGTLIVIGLLIVTFGVLSTIKITPYSLYRNPGLGFQINFPAYWKAYEPKSGAVVIFLSPKQSEIDQMQENVNISIKDLPETMTNEHISELIINQVSKVFGEHIITSETYQITMGGQPGFRFTFYGTGDNVPVSVQYVTAWTMVGKRLYVFTFTGLKTDYPEYEKKVNKMIDSFRFLPPGTH